MTSSLLGTVFSLAYHSGKQMDKKHYALGSLTPSTTEATLAREHETKREVRLRHWAEFGTVFLLLNWSFAVKQKTICILRTTHFRLDKLSPDDATLPPFRCCPPLWCLLIGSLRQVL